MKAAETRDRPEDAAAIRREIERTRAEMSETVELIERRMSPSQLKEQVTDVKEHLLGEFHDAKARLKSEVHGELDEMKEKVKHDLKDVGERVREEMKDVGERVRGEISDTRAAVRDATIGRVEHMIDRAGDTARDAGNSIMDTVRENPIPVAMIGIGLAWLVMGRPGAGRYSTAVQEAPRRMIGRGREVVGQAMDRSKETLSHAVDASRDAAQGLVGKAQERIGGVTDDATELVHRAEDRVTGLAQDARDKVSQYAGMGKDGIIRAEHRVENVMSDNPLAVGAVLFAIGAAAGLALPHSDREDRMMGTVKDQLVKKFEGAARQALGDVENKARTAMQGEPDRRNGSFELGTSGR